MADMEQVSQPQANVVALKPRQAEEPQYSYWVRKRKEQEAAKSKQDDAQAS